MHLKSFQDLEEEKEEEPGNGAEDDEEGSSVLIVRCWIEKCMRLIGRRRVGSAPFEVQHIRIFLSAGFVGMEGR
jgi:hypothetical protein